MTLRAMALVVVIVVSIFSPVRVEAQTVGRNAVIVIIAPPDTKQQLKTLIDDVEAQITGINCYGVGPDRICRPYVLNADPSREVIVLLQIGPNVDGLTLAGNLENELDRTTTAYRHNYFPSYQTRAQLIRVGQRLAYLNEGCDQYVVLQAGDDATNLVFQPLPLVP